MVESPSIHPPAIFPPFPTRLATVSLISPPFSLAMPPLHPVPHRFSVDALSFPFMSPSIAIVSPSLPPFYPTCSLCGYRDSGGVRNQTSASPPASLETSSDDRHMLSIPLAHEGEITRTLDSERGCRVTGNCRVNTAETGSREENGKHFFLSSRHRPILLSLSHASNAISLSYVVFPTILSFLSILVHWFQFSLVIVCDPSLHNRSH